MNEQSLPPDTILFKDTFDFYLEDPEGRRSLSLELNPLTGQGDCVYRGPEGRKCAVGRWIPDEKYHPDFDRLNKNVSAASVQEALPANANIDLLYALQLWHDKGEGFLTSEIVDILKAIKSGPDVEVYIGVVGQPDYFSAYLDRYAAQLG